jgi:uncharacterized membrane protein YjjB (DUF3815 family)
MIINSIFAFITSITFGILFNIRGKNLFFAAIGGGIGWFVNLFMTYLGLSSITAVFIASLIISTYSEIMARVCKSPVSIFLIPCLIPLVPGGGMYYTMLESIQGEAIVALEKGMNTLSIAISLVMGIILVSSLTKLIFSIKLRHKQLKIRKT